MKKLIFYLSAIALLSCNKEDKQTRKVVLECTGTGTHVYMVYTINGDRKTVTGANSPWNYEYEGKKGDVIKLSPNAQGNNVTATIKSNGKVIGSCNDWRFCLLHSRSNCGLKLAYIDRII